MTRTSKVLARLLLVVLASSLSGCSVTCLFVVKNLTDKRANVLVVYDKQPTLPRIKIAFLTFFRGLDKEMPPNRYRLGDDGRSVEFSVLRGGSIVVGHVSYKQGHEALECLAAEIQRVEIRGPEVQYEAPMAFECSRFQRSGYNRVLELRTVGASASNQSFERTGLSRYASLRSLKTVRPAARLQVR